MGCVSSTSKVLPRQLRRFTESQSPKPEFLEQIIEDHKGGINCMELSEDRSLLVTGGEDTTVRLWSTMSQPVECLGVLRGHESYVTCCAIIGCHLVSGSADKTLRVWSVENGDCLRVMFGHESVVNHVICCGRLIFSTSYDMTCRVWDMELFEDIEQNPSSNCIRVFKGHTKSVTQTAFIPQEENFSKIQETDIVVTTSTDWTARTWSLYSGQCLKILRGHTGPINCVAVDSLNKRQIYTGGSDHVIKCWDIVTGDLLRELNGHEGTILVLITHKRILYSGSADKTARAWVMEFGECTRTYWRNQSGVTCVKYFDGMLFTGSCDSSGRIYDAKSGVLKRTCLGHDNAITALQVTNGKMFTCAYDGKVCVWDCKGLHLDTVFGIESSQNEHNDDDDDDSDNIKSAVIALDSFIRNFN